MQAQWRWPPRYPPPPPEPDHVDHVVTIGLWAEDGVQGKLGPGIAAAGVGLAGVYAELSHRRLRPAIEVRGNYSENGVMGTLVGPRVSWRVDQTLFFASGLFGPNHVTTGYSGAPDFAPVGREGITSEFAGGLEAMRRGTPNWGFRLEVSTGRFTGAAQSFPLTLSAGIVLRVP